MRVVLVGIAADDADRRWCGVGRRRQGRDARAAWRAVADAPGWELERRLLAGRIDDAVWSPVGMVALVRDGVIWVGPPARGKLRRLAQGTAPSWSPDGTRIAVVRGGWVWLVGVASGVQHRLVRGGAPAWSPDGRSIAFIAPGGLVEIVGVSGGRPHPVGAVKGVSVDWQPLPASRSHAVRAAQGRPADREHTEAVVYRNPPER